MAKIMQDILIYESGDGGEFSLLNNDLETVGSITNNVYLALFGGNIEQNTDTSIIDGEVRNDWWGNNILDIPFNSNFERTLLNVAVTSAGIRQIEEAALSDLAFLSDLAQVSVEVNIDSVDKISLIVSLQQPDSQEKRIKFVWNQLKNEVIQEVII
jgi:phage gp46-like protein